MGGTTMFQASSDDDAGGWSITADPSEAKVVNNADGSYSITVDGLTGTTASLTPNADGTWSGTVIVEGQSITFDASNLGILGIPGCSPGTITPQGAVVIVAMIVIAIVVILFILKYFEGQEGRDCYASFDNLVGSEACSQTKTGLAGCVPYVSFKGKLGFDGTFDFASAKKVSGGVDIGSSSNCQVGCACPATASGTGTPPDGGTPSGKG